VGFLGNFFVKLGFIRLIGEETDVYENKNEIIKLIKNGK